jgi:hypothetical protein
LADIAFDHTGNLISEIENESDHATRAQRGCQQFAKHPVRIICCAADDQHITFLTLFYGDVDHPVVARLCKHGNRGTRDLRAGPDWAHIRFHQPRTTKRFVRCGDSNRGQRANSVAVGALDVTNDDGLHLRISSTVGNSR